MYLSETVLGVVASDRLSVADCLSERGFRIRGSLANAQSRSVWTSRGAVRWLCRFETANSIRPLLTVRAWTWTLTETVDEVTVDETLSVARRWEYTTSVAMAVTVCVPGADWQVTEADEPEWFSSSTVTL